MAARVRLRSGLAVLGATILDTSLRFPADVEQKLGLPILASIPDAPQQPNRSERQRARIDHHAPVADATSRVGGVAPVGDPAQGA